MSATVKTLHPEVEKPMSGPKFPLADRDGATIFEFESEHGEMHYFVLVKFLSLGPRFYGPYRNEATAKKAKARVNDILIEHEQECNCALVNEW